MALRPPNIAAHLAFSKEVADVAHISSQDSEQAVGRARVAVLGSKSGSVRKRRWGGIGRVSFVGTDAAKNARRCCS